MVVSRECVLRWQMPWKKQELIYILVHRGFPDKISGIPLLTPVVWESGTVCEKEREPFLSDLGMKETW